MYGITLSEIAKGVQGKYSADLNNVIPQGASIDTRTIKKGDIFFALKGEKVDGHLFLADAVEKGAVGAVVSYIPDGIANDYPLILVEDTKKALQQTALLMRKKFTGPVVAVTGSTGKTSTKDMMWSVLNENMPTLRTEGNYNNELGLPLTLLSLKEEHKAVVVEMGMRGLNEIDFLSYLSEPNYGVITNIGSTHLELLGTRERIAQAKAELLSHIPYNGGVVLNYKDKKMLKPWLSNIRSKLIWVSSEKNADIWAEDISECSENEKYGISFLVCTKKGEKVPIFLPVPGRHNVDNALTAYAIGKELGLNSEQIKKGLERTSLTHMRLEIKKNNEKDITIINDTYNANPDSVIASLNVLQDIAETKRKITVLGDMYELGNYTKEGHNLVGRKVTSIGADILFTVGDLAVEIARGAEEAGMSKERINICQDNNKALEKIYSIIHPGDVILVKGSRGVKMEEIVAGLLDS